MSRAGITAKQACEHINKVAQRACEEWTELVSEDPDAQVRLYWIAPVSKERIGRLKVARNDPKRGWRLTANMPMSARWSREEALCFILERVLRVPILKGPIRE